MINVECVVDAKAQTGEAAIWSVRHQALWWADVPAGRLHRHDPETGRNESWETGRPMGCFAETEDGGIVAALTDGFHRLDLATGALTFLSGPKPEERGHRFNDGTVDPRGRFLAGTMILAYPDKRDEDGRLYSYDGRDAREVLGGFTVINGLAFAPDGRTAYVSDSISEIRTIWAYDYDPDDAAWSNRRVFFDTRVVPGRPDGAAIDSAGCYWMAGVGGSQLVRITPDGRVDMEVELPVSRPTRPAFGGRDLATLYVTSIRAEGEPHSGGVFALRVPGVTGLPFPVMHLP